METSILNGTKKILGLDPDYVAFDHAIITHINTAFSTLTQIGVGPSEGFMIEGVRETWDDFLCGDPRFNFVQSYVFLKVKMLFDPPTASYAIDAAERQLTQLEYRLNLESETDGAI